jgi:hypothetical protein
VQDPSLFLKLLKQAEPVAVLASLSLVITVFTFENQDTFQTVYNYSVVSTFMFIFAFVAAVVRNLRIISSERFYSGLATFAFYFFLGIGIIHILLIAVEFGKQHLQIYSFVYGWVFSVIGGMGAIGSTKTLKKYKNLQGSDRSFQVAYFFGFFFVGVGGFGVASNLLTLAFTGSALNIGQELFAFTIMGGFSAIGFVKITEDGVKAAKRRIAKKQTPARGALRWASNNT